jgi:two-component system, chemotaxis family, chemotaxis protein CheY
MAGSPTETTHFSAYAGPDLAPLVCSPAVGEDIFPLHPAKFLPRVLVVDDEGLLRWSLAETLVDAGYQVVQAANGCDARAAMANEQHLIDAMLVDLKLPDTDGLQLVREARRRCLTCPIIVMTAYASDDTLESVIAAGAQGVVAKPFDLRDMLRLVHQLCPSTPH